MSYIVKNVMKGQGQLVQPWHRGVKRLSRLQSQGLQSRARTTIQATGPPVLRIKEAWVQESTLPLTSRGVPLSKSLNLSDLQLLYLQPRHNHILTPTDLRMEKLLVTSSSLCVFDCCNLSEAFPNWKVPYELLATIAISTERQRT